MARQKPAKKATKKSAARKAVTGRQAQGRSERGRAATKSSKKTSSKTAKKGAKKAPKQTARKSAATSARTGVPRPKSAATRARRPARPTAKKVAKPLRTAAKPAAKAKPQGRLLTAVRKLATAAVSAGVSAALSPKKRPNLDRPRRTVADVHGIPSSLDLDRTASSAKSGRAEMRDKLSKSNSGGPAITAGDVDADWQSAESVGDEAPGGDNPTPDQDRVDDIGRALGVEYADDEELQGGAEIAERDLNRWELDPASKDDFEDDED
jgi:hypothetical protein